MIRIAINGLGRIGRCVLRALDELSYYEDIELVAVNAPSKQEITTHLLKYDSVHGIYPNEIKIEDDYLYVGKHIKAKILQERDINNLKWDNIDLLLECSGRFNNKEQSLIHVKNGANKVLVSAPCTNADKSIVYGVNHDTIGEDDVVISSGSCTTNCLAPIAWIIDNELGIESGFMTTIHSYTNDQRIVDSSHSDLRRSRSCAVSMIPTSTGAAKSIGKIIPSLNNKILGSAIRVPTLMYLLWIYQLM